MPWDSLWNCYDRIALPVDGGLAFASLWFVFGFETSESVIPSKGELENNSYSQIFVALKIYFAGEIGAISKLQDLRTHSFLIGVAKVKMILCRTLFDFCFELKKKHFSIDTLL